MGKPSNIYNFLAFAKSCSAQIACDYVNAVNYGKDGELLLGKLKLMRSWIRSIETFIYPCCSDVYFEGVKNFQGKKITMSKNNSVYLASEDQEVAISSEELNCLTEDDICELASRIKKLCSNC